MAETDSPKEKVDIKLVLKENERAEFIGMAATLGLTPEKFAADAILEYMQTLNENPDRIAIIRRAARNGLDRYGSLLALMLVSVGMPLALSFLIGDTANAEMSFHGRRLP